MSAPEVEGLREHHIRVDRTARYYTLGAAGEDAAAAPRELWYLCHGYRQSAERFLGHFRSIRDERRLLVAPEGLSRFYIQPAEGRHGAADRVGASWMTREDREAEIRDYVNYLDALDGRMTAASNAGDAGRGVPPRRVVVGFSQGVHTAARWVVHGRVLADRLILWGAYLPSDLEWEVAAPRLRSLTLTLVRGLRDETADEELQRAEEARLKEWAVPFETVTYDGGHRIDGGVLQKLVEER